MRAAVIGAGSWGTTLAELLARNGHEVTIWAREADVVQSIGDRHVNELFLPDAPLDVRLRATGTIAEAVAGTELVVSAPPSHGVRDVGRQIAAGLGGQRVLVVSVSKGLEPGTDQLLTHVLGEELPGCEIVALSGPSFAREVYARQPTALVAACTHPDAAGATQHAFSNSHLRVYTSTDVVGVQLGGALKNVIALAAGILVGLGLGFNTQAALITRGLAEISRLGAAMGAEPMTFAGLAGMGDLLLTATGSLSRNRSLGIELAQGRRLADILAERRTVAEGVQTARTAVDLGTRHGVELPIAREVTLVLFEDKPPQQAIQDLMERTLKAEQWR
ncbi:MAG: NAD(P)-dependent glycerol-3-phosphate dehydrogenase [Gemmatimonadota bacterium]|nr:NAD(P)-dependent glycerol-3-phosphate dehydrogenase [Gemmatimonadota bacterium]